MLLFCLILGFWSYGQNLRVFFRSQGDSTGFKILWAPENWPEDIQGINVKRRTQNGEWIKLNQRVITPSSNEAEDVADVTTSSTFASRLSAKYDSLITNNKIPILSDSEMYNQFLSNPDRIKFLKFLASVEFDFALILGYGFYDRNPPVANSYSYGIFVVDDSGIEFSEPIHNIDWNYGSNVEIQLDVESEINKLRRKTGIEVIWRIPTAPLDEYNIKGFHVYRMDSLGQRKRLTETPTRVNMAEEIAPLYFVDREIDNTKDWIYEAVPISIFDIEGSPLVAEYQGADFPENLGFELSVGQSQLEDPSVILNWTLNSEANEFIASYRVLRRQQITEKPTVIDSIMEGGIRTFSDESITSSGYYFYRVEFITTQGEQYTSNEQMVYKQLVNKPETPTNLRGVVIKERGQELIYLTWTAPEENIFGYQLYIDAIMNDGLALDGSLGILKQPSYKYPIKSRYGKAYHFAVVSLNTDQIESNLSDTIEIFVPSKSLPQVNIWPIAKEQNQVTLNWNYQDEIEDLEGFRLYQNGELILDESTLGSEARQWVSDPLESGGYSYEIEAVTSYEIASPRSKPRNFTIEE